MLAIEESPVAAAEIDEETAFVGNRDLGVAPRHRGLGQHHVALLTAAENHRAREDESLALARRG